MPASKHFFFLETVHFAWKPNFVVPSIPSFYNQSFLSKIDSGLIAFFYKFCSANKKDLQNSMCTLSSRNEGCGWMFSIFLTHTSFFFSLSFSRWHTPDPQPLIFWLAGSMHWRLTIDGISLVDKDEPCVFCCNWSPSKRAESTLN